MPRVTPESPVGDLDLSVRGGNALEGFGCLTVADVLRLTEREYLTHRHGVFGARGSRKTLRELDAVLEEDGLYRDEVAARAEQGIADETAAGPIPAPGPAGQPDVPAWGMLLLELVQTIARRLEEPENPPTPPAPDAADNDAEPAPGHPHVCERCGHDRLPLFGARQRLEAAADVLVSAAGVSHIEPQGLANAAADVAYALGAVHNDVDSRVMAQASDARADERRSSVVSGLFREALLRAPEILRAWSEHDLELARIKAAPMKGSELKRRRRVVPPGPGAFGVQFLTCERTDLEGVAPGWGCCQCYRRDGAATYNGNQRRECKVCCHPRCDVISGPGPAPEPWPEVQTPDEGPHPDWAIACNAILLRMIEEYSIGGGGAEQAARRSAQFVSESLLRWIVSLDWPTWKATIQARMPIDSMYLSDKRWWMFVRSFRLHCEGIVTAADRGYQPGEPVVHEAVSAYDVPDPGPAPWDVPPPEEPPGAAATTPAGEAPAEEPPAAAAETLIVDVPPGATAEAAPGPTVAGSDAEPAV